MLDNGESRAPRQRPGPASTFTATNGKPILSDRARARRRVEAMERHRHICRELEQLASLVEYYCGSRQPAA